MTRNDLEKLRSLKREITYLQEALKQPQEPSEVIIAYKDYTKSAKGIPRADRGLDDGRENRDRLVRLLEEKVQERIRLVTEMENWIDSVEDPEIRLILRMYYGRGVKHADIGACLGYTASGVKQKLRRFWKGQKF